MRFAALRSALAFLTIAGGAAAPDRRSPAWFAPVGAAAGLAVGGVWWLSDLAFSPLVAAALAVTADAVVTGVLHLDGLADTADGVLPPLPRERRLAVMKAPDVGAFGVAALVLALALRVAAFAALTPDPWLVVGVWAAARGAMAVTMAVVPYARAGGGLASAFGVPSAPGGPGAVPPAGGAASRGPAPGGVGRPGDEEAGGPGAAPDADGPSGGAAGVPPVRVGPADPAGEAPTEGDGVRGQVAAAAAGALVAGGVVVATAGWAGAAAFGVLVVAFAAVVGLARRRLGGFTGDVLGAAGVVAETAALVAASARW